jgi:thiosulfate/3-mercaptopyruvate sulfurtransferase
VAYTTLISTDELAAHLGDSSWLIADCRHDLRNEGWGCAQYEAIHIPGAVFVSLPHDLAAPKTGTNGRHPLPAIETMASTFGQLGIRENTQVVAYDQDAGAYASRLWWMLRYLGHDNVAVLNGGFAKWYGEGRDVRSGVEHRPAVTFTPHVRPGMLVTIDEALAHLGDPSVLLVDARSSERFNGQPSDLDNVPGHIPGARNRFYMDNVGADRTIRSSDELRRDFDQVFEGRSPDQVVMYCGSGVTACHNLLAMEHAGLPGARLYAGSWSEWEADPKRPIERSSKCEGRSAK